MTTDWITYAAHQAGTRGKGPERIVCVSVPVTFPPLSLLTSPNKVCWFLLPALLLLAPPVLG